MMFKNQRGEEVYLADNLTLKELADMDMTIQLTERADQEHQIWQDEEDEEISTGRDR